MLAGLEGANRPLAERKRKSAETSVPHPKILIHSL
jgi:hypothetical protein